jgi:ribosomal protein L34E
MPTTQKKLKPCKDHFLVMHDKATRDFVVCDKCGFKIPGVDTLRPVKLANRWYFDH